MKKLGLSLMVCLFGFQLFAQDSLNMKRMGLLAGMGAEYNDIWGYQHGSKEFAVIGSNSAINVVDVTDCGDPVLVHQWVDGSSVLWRDFKTYGDYIYGVCDGGACQEGLQVINKNTFAQSQSLAQFRSAHNIFIDLASGRLYVADANTNEHGVYVYDVASDPGNPILLKDVRFTEVLNDPSGTYKIHDLYVQNDTAYCSHGYQGYKIWDMTDLDNVSLIGQLDDSNGYNHSSWRHPYEPYMYVAEEVPIGKPIFVYDISDITEPFTVASFKDPLEAPNFTNNRPHNPFALRNRLYISYYHDGVQIYDISDPEDPQRIAYYDTYLTNNGNGYSGYEGAWGVYPYLPSGCILASDISNGLNTLELTITPDADNALPDDDILIDNENRGIIMRTPEEEYVRITVNEMGDLVYTDISKPNTDIVEMRNSNIRFDTTTTGIVLKDANGKVYRLGVEDNGTISTELLTEAPTNALVLTDEDIYLSHIRAGVKLTSPSGNCFIFRLTDGGNPEVASISCN